MRGRPAAAVFARISDPNPPADPARVVMDTAVVLGGSVAGLLAARVLSDHAATVIVIDRDDPGDSAQVRPGVPQATQQHSLLPAGLIQLERLFPGFTEQALAAGARPAPPSARRFYFQGIPRAGGSRAMMLTGTRPFFEAQIRRHTLGLPNVKTTMARVTGLEFGPDAVTGVRYESGGQEGVERADFVVDAMGRSSRLSDWLARAGWERPEVQRIPVDLNYATALLRRKEGDPDVNGVLALRAPIHGVAGAALSQVEGDRWLIGMAGYAGTRPGRTAEDLVHRCKTEFPPEFGQVADNEILGEVRSFRHADSLRRGYHALTRMPAGLVAIGDAVAATNPVYGQGMASAALQASCLSEYLRSAPDLSAPAREFFALQKVVVDVAWGTAAGGDSALPHVAAPPPSGRDRVMRWINGRARPASFFDAEVARQLEEISWLLRHPSSLAAPATLIRVLRASRRAKARQRQRAKTTVATTQGGQMSGASEEDLFSAIEESCGLLNVACAREKVEPFLSEYGFALEAGVFFTTWTGPRAGEFNYALLVPPVGPDPYQRALSKGFAEETGHPVGSLLADFKERFGVILYGAECGVDDGFKEIHAFFNPQALPGPGQLAEIGSMPPSLAANAGLLAEHGVGGSAGLAAINYQERTVSVYFGELRLGKDNVRSLLRGLGMPEPSAPELELMQKSFVVYPTFSWDSPKIERICFAVPSLDPLAFPAPLDPAAELFAKSAPYAYPGKRILVYGFTFTPGERYHQVQSYWTINPPTQMILTAFDANKAKG